MMVKKTKYVVNFVFYKLRGIVFFTKFLNFKNLILI